MFAYRLSVSVNALIANATGFPSCSAAPSPLVDASTWIVECFEELKYVECTWMTPLISSAQMPSVVNDGVHYHSLSFLVNAHKVSALSARFEMKGDMYCAIPRKCCNAQPGAGRLVISAIFAGSGCTPSLS